MIGGVLFVTLTFTMLTISSRDALPANGPQRLFVSLIAPFQQLATSTYAWSVNLWTDYFETTSAAIENRALRDKLARAAAAQNRCRELELENERLRRFVDYSREVDAELIVAKVIGRDPSSWSKSILINKGRQDGLTRGLPVLISEGVVGQIVELYDVYAKVLLITDRSSAVDALVQNSRARGIVEGLNNEGCVFKYALRKEKIAPGDIIISSGFDQVFPKGMRIGKVIEVKKENSELFQAIYLKTFVDFEKLEEVLISKPHLASAPTSKNEDGMIPDVASDHPSILESAIHKSNPNSTAEPTE